MICKNNDTAGFDSIDCCWNEEKQKTKFKNWTNEKGHEKREKLKQNKTQKKWNEERKQEKKKRSNRMFEVKEEKKKIGGEWRRK